MDNNLLASTFFIQQGITTLEIIDTAVKVGLGALISGFSTYLITRQQHQSNIEQERRRRKAEILQEAAEQLENVNHVYLKYSALTNDLLKYHRDGLDLPKNKVSERDQIKAELFNVYKELTNAEAKMMLVDEMGLGDLVREYGDKVTAFRHKVLIKDNPPSENEIEDLKSEILNVRKKLFKALSLAYKKI